MLRITTGNSVYEIDVLRSRARHIPDGRSPSPRFHPDGKWKTYLTVFCANGRDGRDAWVSVNKDITELQTDDIVWFTWPDGQPELRDTTHTSPVRNIEHVSDQETVEEG